MMDAKSEAARWRPMQIRRIVTTVIAFSIGLILYIFDSHVIPVKINDWLSAISVSIYWGEVLWFILDRDYRWYVFLGWALWIATGLILHL